MSCCGQRHDRGTGGAPVTHPEAPTGRPAARTDGARFRYVGQTAITVKGGGTGRIYRFPRSGAVVRVDRRDRFSLRKVPVLLDLDAPAR